MEITKTIKVVADYDITKIFDGVEDLLDELKQYGYEGEYDEENEEFIEALNSYFDDILSTRAVISDEHSIEDIMVDTHNFQSYYTFN